VAVRCLFVCLLFVDKQNITQDRIYVYGTQDIIDWDDWDDWGDWDD
jgi:hypothetical protein